MPKPMRIFLGLLAVFLVVWACAPTNSGTPSTPTVHYVLPTTTVAPAAIGASSTVDATTAAVGGEQVTVADVTDGDTLKLSDGRKVRLLGIDSCEDTGSHKTPGGADATAKADELIAASGNDITLIVEPGAPDVDRYGRLLRYVHLTSGQDFGLAMVGYDHTGVYQGHNDADPSYVGQLYAHDLDYAAHPPSGRECGDEIPPSPPSSSGGDGNVYVPIPHNDDDHHHKSRFCRHHWFC